MKRSNILLIMTDQQRGDCIGIDGHPVLQTPNMDAIAGEGVRFTRCYSTCPVCIPARRSLMSGQFPSTHGLVGYVEGLEWDPPATLPGALSAAGYQTYLVGRNMHLYPRRKRYGFDHMVISCGTREPGDYERWIAEHEPAGGGGYYGTGVMHNDWTAHPWHMDEGLHHTNWTTNEALRFLREVRDPSCPFFLVVSYLAPHPPLVPPAFYFERYLRMELPEPVLGDWAVPPTDDGRGMDVSSTSVSLEGEALRACRAGYYGLINHVDDQIRRLLNPVNGVGRDTVVIFTSDHGEMLGDHFMWRKQLPYEGSARVPLLVRGARETGIQAGRVRDEPVGLEDIMPTVLEAAGVDVPDSVEGRSLLPLLRGEQADWRPHIHGEYADSMHFLTDGKEKYVWFTGGGREQLFDLVEDPMECCDLSKRPESAERIASWRGRLVEELKGRPEGFTDGKRLIPGRPHSAILASAQDER